MNNGSFKILAFARHASEVLSLQKRCHTAAVDLDIVYEEPTLQSLSTALETLEPATRLLIITNPAHVQLSSKFSELQSKELSGGVIFAATADFRFQNEQLRYFYWKHYPRTQEYYHFLDATAFMGKVPHILSLLQSCASSYSPSGQDHLMDLFHRYYADSALGCFKNPVKIKLDQSQEVLASVRLSALNKLKNNWRYGFLYGLNERGAYGSAGLENALQYPLNIEIAKNGEFYHKINKTKPSILIVDQPVPAVPQKPRISLNVKILTKTLRQLYKINRVNKWHNKPSEIFRFSQNKSAELTSATERIVERLEQHLPFSFAHYNDGELTFIQDYLAGNHHNKWFGRQQQQFNPVLAGRLQAAMKFRKDGYFVGVPCSTDHYKLSVLADELVGDYAFKVPAMALHHNLAYLPRILHALKNRNIFFFSNEYQDLSFFRHFGIVVHESQIYKVPFLNSYLEYDHFAEMTFPDDAIVIMTCGMLAKILVHPWYQNHSKLSILALGSCLDDHIQKENSNFELYPKEFPLTKNLYASRVFLFGYKKRCKECFDF